MKKWLRDQSLTLVMLALFFGSLAGQITAGHLAYNQNQIEHGLATVGIWSYLHSSHFLEALFENWESEFLEKGITILLTAFLFQRGAAESKPPEDPTEGEEPKTKGEAPWPVRKGGWIALMYRHSLAIALFGLFAITIALHALAGTARFNEDQLAHGQHGLTVWQFLFNPQFWFESFQNWQSEFLSVAVLIILSIYLRQSGSPESKALEAPYQETGSG